MKGGELIVLMININEIASAQLNHAAKEFQITKDSTNFKLSILEG